MVECKKVMFYEKSKVEAELRSLVKSQGPQIDKYIIDELAQQADHTLLYLPPPYNCQFNPIEMVLSWVKDHFLKHKIYPNTR